MVRLELIVGAVTLRCVDAYCVWCCACDKHHALWESFALAVLKPFVDSKEAAHLTMQ